VKERHDSYHVCRSFIQQAIAKNEDLASVGLAQFRYDSTALTER